jgi:glycosyltransferase involved in cell wall biosynthesis
LSASEEWGGVPVRRVGPYHGMLNGQDLVRYMRGTLLFNLAVFRELHRQRPEVVHASDAEAFLGCALYTMSARNCTLLYNIHDNLSERYPLPNFVRRFLNVVEGLFVLFARATAVPEPFRRDSLPFWCRKRVQVVRNAPVDVGFQTPLPLRPGPVRVFYAGWLDEGRGLRGLLQLARTHSAPEFEVRIAGDGDNRLVREVVDSPCTYLGFLSHEEVLAETKKAHFVAAFYDPVRPINRDAAPNKLAEALSVGRPVLMNPEVRIGQSPQVREGILHLSYPNDVQSFSDDATLAIQALSEESYLAMCQAARASFEQHYSWPSTQAAMRSFLASAFEVGR